MSSIHRLNERRDNLTARVIRIIDSTFRDHDYEQMPLATLYTHMLLDRSWQEQIILREAGIIPACRDRCEASKHEATERLRKFLRQYKHNKSRPFVYVPDGCSSGNWVHVDGLCYLATIRPESREDVIKRLQEVAAALEKQSKGAAATAKAIRAYVGELKSGKAFEQPKLLGAA